MSDMRTPLKKVRGLGSAHEGTDHFWRQRLTSVANIPLLLFFIGLIVYLHGASFAETRAALSHPLIALVMLMVIISGLVHMRLGMRVIIEDYVTSEGKKIACLMLNTFFTLVVGVACVFAIIKLSFGG